MQKLKNLAIFFLNIFTNVNTNCLKIGQISFSKLNNVIKTPGAISKNSFSRQIDYPLRPEKRPVENLESNPAQNDDLCSNRPRSKTPSTPTLTSSTSPSPPTFQSIGQKTGPHWERSLQGSSTTMQTNSISPKMSAQSEQGSDWTTGIVVWNMHLSDFLYQTQ